MAKNTENTAEKKVTIRLPIERGTDNEDMYVAVQGEAFQIKRGVDVEVPVRVAEVIRESEDGYLEAYRYQKAKESK